MGFIEELNNLSDRIVDFKDKVKGEQATKMTFIIPFIRLLGYDVSNPTEVKYEFTADIGTKQGEKVDLAILQGDKVIMLIECKDSRSDISKADVSQLYRYFTTVTEARIGVLTNGVIYRFYTDSEKPNVMDTKPFFEFNMSDINPSLVYVLNNFTKKNFDLDKTRSTAIDLKHRGEIKQILNKQLEAPTKGFVEFFHKAIESRMKVQDFTDVVKRAFNEFLDEQKIIQPNGSDEEKQPNGSDEESPDADNKNLLRFTNLRVTMPDGTVIHHASGKETYLEALEKLGLEKVMRVRADIVSTEQFPLRAKGVKQGEFWVRGTISYGGTNRRKKVLDEIADLLGVKLIVEQVEKIKI